MPERLVKRIGTRIRQLRTQKGHTLDGLAEKINITSGRYLGRIERGEINCTLETLEAIAKGLGVRVDDFFTHDLDDKVMEMVDLVRNQDEETKSWLLKALKTLLEKPSP